MKRSSRHIEWLSLIEVSGPFLAVSLLDKAFPQGLEKVETPRRQKLRAAYDEWCEARDEDDPELPALHREWLHLVLQDMLEYEQEVLVDNAASETLISYRSPEHGVSFVPDLLIKNDGDDKPRLLVSVQPPGTDFEKVKTKDGWPVSLMERMVLLCRSAGVRLGLLTNGERWMLVNAPVGATSSHASWYARLWFQEPLTLKAFQSLLGVRRFFGPEDETLDRLLEKSLEHQEEVTDTLGEQVRRAVEVLVQCLDKADQDRNRELLRDVSPAELYEAGLTVMMRLVFILCAEERGLLLLGDTVYDECYAVSTLRGLLEEDADRHGPEVLERRHDAWARLLAAFRAVFGGIEHEALRLPAMGGSLFDPDRFPFLEGRLKGTTWRDTPAEPLPIDNRTVLLLLEALQILEQPGGALLLSYRALDVEQIGHVYEGLLEHTVARVPSVTLGLIGSKKAKNPNVPLADLESAMLDGEDTLVPLVQEVTQRSLSALKNALKADIDDAQYGRLLLVCGGDEALANRIQPFSNLLRTDAWGEPIVYRADSFMVTLGTDRRESGTHYTPKSLTETVVATTLEPVAYTGPAEGLPREKWRLKSSEELLELKVCDPAMGSGAFLVQACRWLGERLVEAWGHEEAQDKTVTIDGKALEALGESEPMPSDTDERLIIARRLVAERCLYGVDINPLAVELAKLSIWLVTLAEGRPFEFLDHSLRSGDSLLGVHRLDQLTTLSMNPDNESNVLPLFEQILERPIEEAVNMRKQLRQVAVRDIHDVEAMTRLDLEARRKLENIEAVANVVAGESLRFAGETKALESAMARLSTYAGDFLSGDDEHGDAIVRWGQEALGVKLLPGKPQRKPLHWVLDFPEVFQHGGFHAILSNPPYLGGKRISYRLGERSFQFLKQIVGHAIGTTDLCVFFLLRAAQLTRTQGCIGLVVSDIVRQGDSRLTGLATLAARGMSVYSAISSTVWPGTAGVKISLIHVVNGQWRGRRMLDGEHVHSISSFLRSDDILSDTPFQLAENKNLCFTGHYLMGQGFVLSESEASDLISARADSAEVIFDYIRGDDVNNCHTLITGQKAINFGTRTLEECRREYPECLEWVETRVKPEREEKKAGPERENWWLYARPRPALEKATAGMRQVLVQPFTAKYVTPCFVPTRAVYAHPLVVIVDPSPSRFASLQSTVHSAWVWQYCSTSLELLRYTASSVLNTFPFPDEAASSTLVSLGSKYIEVRDHIRLTRSQSANEIYNRFHDPEETGKDIDALRRLHAEIDNAMVTAYGWDDLELGHGFHETKQGVRFTIFPKVQREVLQRLLKLNHERYEQEVEQGGHGKNSDKITPARGRKKKASDGHTELFDSFGQSLIDVNKDGRPHDLVLSFLKEQGGWHSRADILAGIGVENSKWQRAIGHLLETGAVERQGERRGTSYRATTHRED